MVVSLNTFKGQVLQRLVTVIVIVSLDVVFKGFFATTMLDIVFLTILSLKMFLWRFRTFEDLYRYIQDTFEGTFTPNF